VDDKDRTTPAGVFKDVESFKRAVASDRARRLPRWDYTFLPVGATLTEMEELGAQGWELVTATSQHFYFKRQTNFR